MTISKVAGWRTSGGQFFESRDTAECAEIVEVLKTATGLKLQNVTASPTSLMLEFTGHEPIVVTAVVHEGYPRLRISTPDPLVAAK